MDTKDCKGGYIEPHFHHITSINAIRERYEKDGVAFIDGCDENNLVNLAKHLGQIAEPRNEIGNGTGISNIRYEPDLVGKGYSSEELFFHTDRSGWDLPPRLLLATLKVQSQTGGESLFVDGSKVIEAVKAHHNTLYELLTNSKHSSSKADNGTFQARPIYDEKTGIFRFRFDDGIQLSNSLTDRFSDLRQLVYDHAYAITLKPGQSYLVDNHRFLHGRTSFTGPRELLRIHAHPHGRHTVRPILFNVDGTLCRSETLSIDAFYRCISDVVGKGITHVNTRVNLHGRTDRSLLHEVLRYHGLENLEVDLVMKEFFSLHPRYLEGSLAKGLESKPCLGVKEFLDWLAADARNHSQTRPRALVGLLTGNSQPNALLKLKAAGIDTSIFDLNISSFGDQHATRLSLVQDAVKKVALNFRISLDAGDVALVGDTPLDIECARQIGCGIVAVSTGHYLEELEVFKPGLACESLMEAKDYFRSTMCLEQD